MEGVVLAVLTSLLAAALPWQPTELVLERSKRQLRVIQNGRQIASYPVAVGRATNPASDATVAVCPASAFRHTPRGRRNHRPRRGARRHRPEDSGVDNSAARSLSLFFHSHFLCLLWSPS